MKNWLYKVFGRQHGEPTPWTSMHYTQNFNPDKMDNIYQVPDFPWVFLGGKDPMDMRIAEALMATTITQSPQIYGHFKDKEMIDFDVRDIPEHDMWSEEEMNVESPRIEQRIEQLKNLILDGNYPIFVHCAGGRNRSPTILAAALQRAIGESSGERTSYFDLLSQMKEERPNVGPDDAMVWMTADPETKKQLSSISHEDAWQHYLSQGDNRQRYYGRLGA